MNHNIHIDDDPQLGFERPRRLTRALHFVLIPVLNYLPGWTRVLLKKTHRSAAKVVDHIATHEAVEVFYSREGARAHRNVLHKLAYHIWFDTKNPMALRNRLRIVEREVTRAMRALHGQGQLVSVLNIAAGSARATIESVHALSIRHPELVDMLEVTFLDKNPRANHYSRKLAARTGWLHQHARWITGSVSDLPRYFRPCSAPNVVEMVGLLEYFPDARMVKVLSLIREQMQAGGYLITANIMDNDERRFVTNLVGWKLIYRDPAQLIRLAELAGFSSERITVCCEPLKIHFVMVVQK